MNKVVVITGGSEGLGKEIARSLVSNSDKVIVLARNEEKLKATSKELNCEYEVCDVSDSESLEKVVKNILSRHERIDVLVNNAGLLLEGSIDENSYEDIEKVVKVNVVGYMFMAKAVIPDMKKKGSGFIINISSQSGLYHRHKRAVYNPTKWAITGFTKCLQADLSPFNIRVTGLFPGKMNTSMFNKANADTDMSDSLDTSSVAETVKFLVNSPETMVISELGMKSINQNTIETICY